MRRLRAGRRRKRIAQGSILVEDIDLNPLGRIQIEGTWQVIGEPLFEFEGLDFAIS
jgi:hypothetical protein